MNKENIKEVIKEMIKSGDISLNESSDENISKNELIKYLREMQIRSIDRSKNLVFWNSPDTIIEINISQGTVYIKCE